jgi:hypothetical protein
MKPVRFTIPEKMLPYLLYAVWEVSGSDYHVMAVKNAKGYEITYTMSREDDNRVRKIMTDSWKTREQHDLSSAIFY